MKTLSLILLCLFSVNSANASLNGKKNAVHSASSTNKNALALIKKIEKKRANLKNKLKAQDLIKILQPDTIRQGDAYSLYFQSNTEITGTNSLIDLTIDSNPAELEQPAKGLFIYHSSGESEIKTHNAVAKLSIEDAAEAKSLRDAITQLDAEIQALQDQIDEMEPGSEQDALIAQRDEKVAIKNQLVAALAAIKSPIGEEAFSFKIIAAVGNNPDFFRILSVAPSFGSVSGGTELTITGQRFPTGMEAILGSVTVPVTFVSSTEVRITSPDFTLPGAGGVGIKSLELKKAGATPQDPVKNATRSNVFYAATITTPPLVNVKPVAVAGASQSVNVGAEVTMNGSSSYDQNPGTTLSYSWTPISVPAGSGIPTGATYSADQSFNFTPSKPGSYVWELVVNDGEFNSEASLTVVTANPSTNSAPQPSASNPLAIIAGQSGTSQILHGDIDDYQAHSYVITKQSSFGTASVSSTGLINFTAGAAVGSDSMEIAVVDNGNPPLSGSVSIPVQVVSSVVTVDDLYSEGRSRDGLITMGMGANTLNSTMGQIASVVWDFGDGTTGLSAFPFENDGWVEHDYLTSGTYTATVTVTDGYGASASKSITFPVGTSAMPVAHLVSNVFSGPAPLTVNFDATGSTDDVGITQYRFRYNDGSPDEVNATGITSHTFTQEGDYSIRLRSIDADQNFSQVFVNIHVGDDPSPQMSLPVAFMDLGTKEVLIGSSPAFSAVKSYDPNPSGSIADYQWNFNDYYSCDGSSPNPGCAGSGANVTHSYAFTQNYWPELRVLGALGGESPRVYKEVIAINAGHAPRAVPGWDELWAVPPYTLNVNGSYSYDYDGTISSYVWNFGNNSCTENCPVFDPISSPTGSITFDEGTYYVNLEITDNDGNKHNRGYNLFVYPNKAVKEKMERQVKAKLKKHALGGDHDRDMEKNRLSMLCSKGKASACYDAGKMFEEDGNSYVAGKFFAKACALGYSQACSVR